MQKEQVNSGKSNHLFQLFSQHNDCFVCLFVLFVFSVTRSNVTTAVTAKTTPVRLPVVAANRRPTPISVIT
jgi:hypothetical protein